MTHLKLAKVQCRAPAEGGAESERAAILSAATRIIAAQGAGASLHTIAKEAGVASGLLFTYFRTKAELLNALHVDIRLEMFTSSMEGTPYEGDNREQMFHIWRGWLQWATSYPVKRRAMQRLREAEEITAKSRQITDEAHLRFRAVIQRILEDKPIRSLSSEEIYALLAGVSDATSDFIISDPANREKYSQAGFDSMWRLLA